MAEDEQLRMPPFEFHLEEAASIPPEIRFGGSSWTYEAWKGAIFKREYPKSSFAVQSLAEYSHFPIFRTVCIDSTFYRPATQGRLLEYASLVPDDFVWVSKVWEHITAPWFSSQKRYGASAGRTNPDFLNARLMHDAVLSQFDHPEIVAHTGPFVFQFPNITTMGREAFLSALGEFLPKLPRRYQYAVEIRNPEFLTAEYFQTLNASGVTHVFNQWHVMPRLLDQMKAAAAAGGLEAPFIVSRLITPHLMSYERATKMMAPFLTLTRPDPAVRQDVARLVKRAMERGTPLFVLVNNKAEGNAPMTVDGLVVQTAAMFKKGVGSRSQEFK